MEEKLLLGVGRTVITPKIGEHLYGYPDPPESTSVHDDLTATAFYFKQGDKATVLVSNTVCSIPEDIAKTIADEIEKRHGIPKEAILLHAIHTHSGPSLYSSEFGWGDINTEYRDGIFIPNILAAVNNAINNVKSVKMAIASGESYVGINRRELTAENRVILGQNPWGPFNPKMTVISFKGDDGAPVANIVHYGAHPTAAGKNTEISRDWPGVMIDVLEAETGAVTAFINGPEGDVGPRLTNGLTVGLGDINNAMRLGAVAAQDAVRIYKKTGGYYTPKLSCNSKKVKIPLLPRLTPEEANAQIEEYKKEIYHPNVRKRMTKYYTKIIDSYKTDYVDKENFEFNQNIIRLGDVAIVAFPYELFSEIGMRIDRASEIAHVLSIVNTNGAYAYFPTESELCRGGYEIQSFTMRNTQPYVHDADWYAVTETLKNLKELKE